MMWRSAFAAAAALSVIGGAAGAQTRPPANWQSMVDTYLEGYLKDPYTAVKKVTRGPRYGHIPTPWKSSPANWMVCYSINARNSFGGYEGAETYLFVFDDRKVVTELHGRAFRNEISDECSAAADDLTPGLMTDAPAENPKTPL